MTSCSKNQLDLDDTAHFEYEFGILGGVYDFRKRGLFQSEVLRTLQHSIDNKPWWQPCSRYNYQQTRGSDAGASFYIHETAHFVNERGLVRSPSSAMLFSQIKLHSCSNNENNFVFYLVETIRISNIFWKSSQLSLKEQSPYDIPDSNNQLPNMTSTAPRADFLTKSRCYLGHLSRLSQ